MQFLYNTILFKARVVLALVALFNEKIKLFRDGRKETFPVLERTISKEDKVIWFHCASLGEFEQGRPVIEGFKEEYPDYKIVLTFFSPSGYEIQKNYKLANVVCYLPLDTVSNVKRFLKLVHPSVAVFVKYEFWPNLLSEIIKEQIPTVLISGIFRKDQLFFKKYGTWMRSKLKAFHYFFVQDVASEKLLKSIGFSNVEVSGDTRFDRVYDVLQRDNTLDFIHEFVDGKYTLVAGSTWKEDEELLVKYINEEATSEEKFIIAPHNIKKEGVEFLRKSLEKKTVLFSEKEGKNLEEYQVFIIDTIGILTKIYSYANVAYVGGGFTKSGIHNILEPATFGVPIVIGSNYNKFNEAIELVNRGACKSISVQEELNEALSHLKGSLEERVYKGKLSKAYIKESLGASAKILKHIKGFI